MKRNGKEMGRAVYRKGKKQKIGTERDGREKE